MKNQLVLILLCFFVLIYAHCTQKQQNTSELNAAPQNNTNSQEQIINNIINADVESKEYNVSQTGREQGLQSDNIKKVYLFHDEIICLSESGITKINMETGKIVNFAFMDESVFFLSSSIINNTLMIIEKNGIYQFQDNKLTLVKKESRIIPELVEYKNTTYFMKDNNLYQLDKNNLLHLKAGFTNLNLQVIRQYDGQIYLGSAHALYQYDPDNQKITNIISLPNININDFLVKKDTVYFGEKQLYAYNIPQKSSVILLTSQSNNYITALFKEDDIIYIGQNSGLLAYNITTKRSVDLLKDYAVKNAYINDILKEDRTLYLGTKNYGLVKLYKVQNEF